MCYFLLPIHIFVSWANGSIKYLEHIMSFDNKSIVIIGLIVGGIASLYTHQTELASAIFGGLVGYLSHEYIEGESTD